MGFPGCAALYGDEYYLVIALAYPDLMEIRTGLGRGDIRWFISRSEVDGTPKFTIKKNAQLRRFSPNMFAFCGNKLVCRK